MRISHGLDQKLNHHGSAERFSSRRTFLSRVSSRDFPARFSVIGQGKSSSLRTASAEARSVTAHVCSRGNTVLRGPTRIRDNNEGQRTIESRRNHNRIIATRDSAQSGRRIEGILVDVSAGRVSRMRNACFAAFFPFWTTFSRFRKVRSPSPSERRGEKARTSHVRERVGGRGTNLTVEDRASRDWRR